METKRVTPNVKRQEDTNALMDECKVFWAFGNEQFKEGVAKLNLQDNETLVSIGAGGYMPKKNKEKYIAGMKRIHKEFTEAMKDEKARKAHILYELWNHEAYYTGSIESTMDALGEEFTYEEVMQVFKKNKVSECPNCQSLQPDKKIDYLGDQKYECPNCKKV